MNHETKIFSIVTLRMNFYKFLLSAVDGFDDRLFLSEKQPTNAIVSWNFRTRIHFCLVNFFRFFWQETLKFLMCRGKFSEQKIYRFFPLCRRRLNVLHKTAKFS